MCVWSGAVPKIALRLDDLLGQLTELRNAIFIIMGHYSERTQIKISKGKKYIGQCPGQTGPQASNCPFLAETHRQHLIIPATRYNNM